MEASNVNPTALHNSRETAATIQQAVDAALLGDGVLAINGVYAFGGRAIVGKMTNRVAVDKPLIVSSVNGPQYTIIQGRQLPCPLNGSFKRC